MTERTNTPNSRTSMSVDAWSRQIDFHNIRHDKLNQGVVPVWIALQLVEELREARSAVSESAPIAPPTAEEIAAYRDLFRAELDKRMDTKHPSASPSTEAHGVALRRFVGVRNKNAAPQAGTTAAPPGRATASQDPVRDTEPAAAAPGRDDDKPLPLNCDRDAARWAREFNEALARAYPDSRPNQLDEGWLIGWFANAMMCGEDTYRWRLSASGAPDAMREVLQNVASYRMWCRCSPKEIDSGHHVDCHVPEFQAMQEWARSVLGPADRGDDHG